MDDSPKNITLTFIIDLMISVGSAYLFSWKLINLNTLIVILVLGVIFIIITGFKSKLNRVEKISKKQNLKITKLEENIKIHEKFINIEARIIALERGNKNGKK